jgi:hypothetical protein
MGWLITKGQTKTELIKHVTEGDPNLRTHRKCVRGNVLWTIQENLKYPEFGRFIVAYLMVRDPGYGWGYKPVTESMGPAELSCPASYLDEAPVPDSEFAAPWRARVRRRHADKQRLKRTVTAASIGDQVTLTEGCVPHTVTLASTKPLIGRADDGSHWRIPRRCIASIKPAV